MSSSRSALVVLGSAALGVATALALGWFDPGWDPRLLAVAFIGALLTTRPVRWALDGLLGVPELVRWVRGRPVTTLFLLVAGVLLVVALLLVVGVVALVAAKPEWFGAKRLALGAAVLAAVLLLGWLGSSKDTWEWEARWFALPGFGAGFGAVCILWNQLVDGASTLWPEWSFGFVPWVLVGIAVVDLLGYRLGRWLSPRMPWETFFLLGAAAVGVAVFVDWGGERRERKAILPVSNGAVAYLRFAGGGRVSVDAVVKVGNDIRKQPLISSVKPDSSVAWAPRGRKLAFVRGAGSTSHIWTYDFIEREAIRVTAKPGDYDDPAWSPDGRRIAFTKRVSKGIDDIYVSSTSRHSKAIRLTPERASDVEPTWSPDGEEIAFASDRTGQYDIYVMGADGARVARLTRGPRYSAPDRQPAWSPNGRTLAFVSRTAAGRRADIYLVDADGRGEVTNLTEKATASSTDPAWAPDATEIAFTRMHAGRRTVFRVVVQGPDEDDFGHTERLEGAATPSFAPAWKPLPDRDMLRYRYPADELVQRYAPLVRLHEHEEYWPMAASEFIAMSGLAWVGCGKHDPFEKPPVESKLGGGERPKDTADAYKVDRSECAERTGTSFVHDRTRPKNRDAEGFVLVPDEEKPLGHEPTARNPGTLDPKLARLFIPRSVPVYFEHVVGRSITYWMFYGFSATEPAGRIGSHQGDWERVTVCLDPEERPVSVVYHRHNTNRARSWTLVPKFGTHPVVYSAQGSHAAYPSAGTNPVLGSFDRRVEGAVWATWGNLSDVLTEEWYGYGGSWGVPPGPDGPSRFKVGDAGC